MKIAAIVACNKDRVIGKDGTLPWHLPEDLKRFSTLTKPHTVLMGRKTYESLPVKFRPLPDRFNVVLSRKKELSLPENVLLINDVRSFFEDVRSGVLSLPTDEVWVIGGEQIYAATMDYLTHIYLTEVDIDVDGGDAFMPKFDNDFEEVSREKGNECEFVLYERVLASS